MSKGFEDVKIPREYDLRKIVERLLTELQTGPLDQAAIKRIRDAGKVGM